MDINQLCIVSAFEFSEKQKHNQHINHFERGLMTGSFEEGFMAGYLAAQPKWFPMQEAPKDGTEILLSNGVVTEQGYFSKFDDWFEVNTDLFKDFKPIAWTHLPVYKP